MDINLVRNESVDGVFGEAWSVTIMIVLIGVNGVNGVNGWRDRYVFERAAMNCMYGMYEDSSCSILEHSLLHSS